MLAEQKDRFETFSASTDLYQKCGGTSIQLINNNHQGIKEVEVYCYSCFTLVNYSVFHFGESIFNVLYWCANIIFVMCSNTVKALLNDFEKKEAEK